MAASLNQKMYFKNMHVFSKYILLSMANVVCKCIIRTRTFISDCWARADNSNLMLGKDTSCFLIGSWATFISRNAHGHYGLLLKTYVRAEPEIGSNEFPLARCYS